MIKVTTWHLSKVTVANVCRKHKAAFVARLFAGLCLFISKK